MFKLSIPQTSKKGDVTFFRSGLRFSNEFIEREILRDANYIWIFLDEPFIAFSFMDNPRANAVKLTKSSKNTLGKTVSCAYLKDFKWIKDVMESESILTRKFTVKKAKVETDIETTAKHVINLNENIPEIPKGVLDEEIPF